MTLTQCPWMRRVLTAFILLAPALTAFSADISRHVLLRDRAYYQDTATSLKNHSWGGWQAIVSTEANTSTSVLSAWLTTPDAGGSLNLSTADGLAWGFTAPARFATGSQFDAQFPAGNYQFNATTTNDGAVSVTATIPAGVTAPSAPMLTGFPALSSIDASQPLAVSWSPWTAGTNNDAACVIIENAAGTRVIYASDPFTNNPGGAASSFVIPARTLKPGESYLLSVRLIKVHQPQPLVYSSGTVLAGTSTTVTTTIATREAHAYAFGSRAFGALGEGTYDGWSNRFEQVATQVNQVYASTSQLFLIKNDGSFWATGNQTGSLQENAVNSYSRFQHITAQTDVVQAAAGIGFILFLKNDGSLWGVGGNTFGQLGILATNTLTPVKIADDVAAIAAGSYSSYFIKTDGTLWGLGRNNLGQLGTGTTTDQASPVPIHTSVASITAANDQAILVRTNGDAFAMGSNNGGRLGLGSVTIQSSPALVGTGVASAATGLGHSLLLFSNGNVHGTGSGLAIGNGGTSTSTWTSLGAVGVTRIAAGTSHSVFLLSNGSVYTAGNNNYGQLGDFTNTSRSFSQLVETGVSSIAAAGNFTALKKTDGTVWVTGENSNGQLGDNRIFQASPVHISLLPKAIFSSATYTLALGSTNGVPGYAFSIGMGNARGVTNSGIPSSLWAGTIYSANDIADIAAGTNQSYLITTSGQVYSAGVNTNGQLGRGTALSSPTHQLIPTLSGIAKVSSGGLHTLFLGRNGTLWAAGSNSNGQLGDGTLSDRNVPVQIAVNVADIAAGGSTSAFIQNDGTLWTMGLNSSGQLGDGTTVDQSSPVQVAAQVRTVSTSGLHTVFIKNDDTLWVVGSCNTGQLGDGTLSNRSTPMQIATDVHVASASINHTLFLKNDGTLWASGSNATGQLGSAILTLSTTPIQVTSLSRINSITTSGSRSYAFVTPPAPSINVAPAATVSAGTSLTLTVSAPGVASPTFIWLKDGAVISGATSPTLNIPSAIAANSGNYQVIVEGFGAFPIASDATPITVHNESQTSFSAWVAANFTTGEQADPAVSGPGADPEKSGYSNLVRYALQTPARGPVQVPPSTLSISGNSLRIQFTRKAEGSGLRYIVEASNNLVTWTPLDIFTPGRPTTVTVQDTETFSPASRRFLRVRVEETP
jgi:alpha-tubulin suppressor-like RCC1 family protein